MHQSQSVGLETKLKVFLNMTLMPILYHYLVIFSAPFWIHWWVPYAAKLITKTY